MVKVNMHKRCGLDKEVWSRSTCIRGLDKEVWSRSTCIRGVVWTRRCGQGQHA